MRGSKDKDKWIIVISCSNSNFNIKTLTFTTTYDDMFWTTTNRIQTYNSTTTDCNHSMFNLERLFSCFAKHSIYYSGITNLTSINSVSKMPYAIMNETCGICSAHAPIFKTETNAQADLPQLAETEPTAAPTAPPKNQKSR